MTTDVLLTGFAPFAGAAVNESWEAVRRAAPLLRVAGPAVKRRATASPAAGGPTAEGLATGGPTAEGLATGGPTAEGLAAGGPTAEGLAVEILELPVEFDRAGELLAAAVREHRPSLVVAVGLAAGRAGITPERVALNVRDARIPDNAGASPVDEPVAADGPVGYFSTLPIKAMVAALTAERIPGSVSQTAGTYVCNDVFFALQHLLATDGELAGIRGGFVHVPSADVVDSLTAARALARMVEVALRTEVDASLAGGAEH